MADLVLGDVKPRPVRIHGGGSDERPLQPFVTASGQGLERKTAYVAELLHVVLEGLVAKETTPLGAEREGRPHAARSAADGTRSSNVRH